MAESVLEAAWKYKRQVKLRYNQGQRRGLLANGYVVEIKPDFILFRALGGFDFQIALQDLFQIDGRNPFVDDVKGGPEPTENWMVVYRTMDPKYPQLELTAYGKVSEEPNGVFLVEMDDGRTVRLPKKLIVRIENPSGSGGNRIGGFIVKGSNQPTPNSKRLPPGR